LIGGRAEARRRRRRSTICMQISPVPVLSVVFPSNKNFVSDSEPRYSIYASRYVALALRRGAGEGFHIVKKRSANLWRYNRTDDSRRSFRGRSLRLARKSITQPTTMRRVRSSPCFRQSTAALGMPLTQKGTVRASSSPKKNSSFTPARQEWRRRGRATRPRDAGKRN
jgi:hypothetical protein